jgi:antitoxin MazE
MKTLVQRWGNSLAVRIPKTFAEEISVREGDEVEMTITRGRLVVVPRPEPEYDVSDLIKGIHQNNTHKEVSVGDRRGQEAW